MQDFFHQQYGHFWGCILDFWGVKKEDPPSLRVIGRCSHLPGSLISPPRWQPVRYLHKGRAVLVLHQHLGSFQGKWWVELRVVPKDILKKSTWMTGIWVPVMSRLWALWDDHFSIVNDRSNSGFEHWPMTEKLFWLQDARMSQEVRING